MFLKLLRELQDLLPKDGLNEQLDVLTIALATSIRHFSNLSTGSFSPVSQHSIQSFLKVSGWSL